MTNAPYILHRPQYGVHQVSARETGAHVGTVECLQRARYQATRPDGESRWFTTRRDACHHLISWHTERENERAYQALYETAQAEQEAAAPAAESDVEWTVPADFAELETAAAVAVLSGRTTECETCGCDVPAGALCHCARGLSCPDEVCEDCGETVPCGCDDIIEPEIG